MSPARSTFLILLWCSVVAAGTRPSQAQRIDLEGLQQLLGEPVTTVVTGSPKRASEAPADIEIITADQIRRSGADNLPDMLRFVAGIDVRRYGFAAADVGIRGYNETSNPRLLVLLNGQQVYLDDLGRTQWYSLPVTIPEIKQIEVVRGPNTALLGFNAASGAINIVTYDPLHDAPMNVATASIGTQDFASASVVGTGRLGDRAAIRLFGDGFKARDFAPIDVAPVDRLYRRSPERGAAGFSARAVLAPGVELYGSGAFVNTRMWEATSSPYFGTDYHRTNWARLGLTADTSWGLVGINVYRNELSYSFSGATETEDIHDTVYVASLNDTIKLGAHHALRLGIDFRSNAAKSSNVLAGNISYQVLSTSAMWDWQIADGLSLTNAVRFDHFTLAQHGLVLPQSNLTSRDFRGRAIDEPSFNTGLVWNVTESDTLRLLGGRGLQLPSIYDLGLQDLKVFPGDGRTFTSQTFLAMGNPYAQAASVLNAEIVWDRRIPAIGGGMHVAAFAQRTDNILTNPYEVAPLTVNNPDGTQFALAKTMNTGYSSAAGLEIGARGQSTGGFRWNASYSFIAIDDHPSAFRSFLFSPQDFANNTPAHVVVLGAGYSHGPWELDAQVRWQSKFLDYRVSGTDSTLTPVWVSNQLVFNARAAYSITPKLVVSLVGQQLNAVRLLQSAAPPIERRIFLGVSAGW